MTAELLTLQYLALAFAVVLALLWVIFEASRRSPDKPKRKSRIFACGMEASPSQLNVPSGNFYEYIKRFLRSERLSELHSGKLSHYIVWILIGMALVMVFVVGLW